MQSAPSGILVHRKGEENRVFTLPLTIGRSGLCDVVVASDVVPPCAAVVFAKDEQLQVWDPVRKRQLPIDTLQRFQIKVQGPVSISSKDGAVRKNLFTRFSQILCWERDLFARLPMRLQSLLGGRWQQRTRLSVGAGVAVLLLSGASTVARFSEAKDLDLSKTPIALTLGKVAEGTYGHTWTYRGYKHGMTLTFTIPERTAENVAGDHVLAFEAGGLDEEGEVEIFVGEKSIFRSMAEPGCARTMCHKEVPILGELTHAGENTLLVKHRGASSYMIRRLVISGVKDLTTEESLKLDQHLTRAERAFADRDIMVENVLEAHDLLKQASDLCRQRRCPADREAKVLALVGEVNSGFNKTVEDLWFQAGKAQKLHDIESAKRALDALTRLFPDPSSKERQKIKTALDELRDEWK